VLWSAYCAFSLMFTLEYARLSSGLVGIMVLVAAGLWAASEALRALAVRGRWLEKPPAALLVRLLAWPVLLAAVVQVGVITGSHALVAARLVAFAPGDATPGWGQLAGYTVNMMIMLWLWAGAWGGALSFARWRQGEVEKWQSEAARRSLELQVLRAQVNPHFIFNAMNNLRALISEDPERARDMVTRLSNTLRHTLQHSANERVPLVDELAIVRDYVAIEQLHYEERLRVRWNIAPDAQSAQVPPMVLQLLVENAIKHGVARSAMGGDVQIDVAREGGSLTVIVSNPGRWSPGPRAGIGLAHLRERLDRAGGPGARCVIGEAAGRVEVRLTMAAWA
jgi:signal transduction histidine kinase